MTNTENKVLTHIYETLNSFDTYPVYRAISSKIDELGIGDNVKKNILDAFSDEINKESNKIKEAKSWVDTLLKDLK